MRGSSVNIFEAVTALRSFSVMRSFEKTLRRGWASLKKEARRQIGDFVKSSQTAQGGFADRAGRPDIYYTLFGYLVSRALKINIDRSALYAYIRAFSETSCVTGADALAQVVLARIVLNDKNRALRLYASYKNRAAGLPKIGEEYSVYLELLALVSIGNFSESRLLVRSFGSAKSAAEAQPTPLVAAGLIIAYLRQHLPLAKENTKLNRKVCTEYAGRRPGIIIDAHNGADIEMLCGEIIARLTENGGIRVSRNIEQADLLSTAVGSYALNLCGFDLRPHAADLLDYVISLFESGSFAVCEADRRTDIEYLFYGLLALGALSG